MPSLQTASCWKSECPQWFHSTGPCFSSSTHWTDAFGPWSHSPSPHSAFSFKPYCSCANLDVPSTVPRCPCEAASRIHLSSPSPSVWSELTPNSPDLSFLWDILDHVPSQLWSSHAYEVGHVPSADPVQITLNQEKPLLCVPRYCVSKEAEEGIQPLLIPFYSKASLLVFTVIVTLPFYLFKKQGRTPTISSRI